MVYKLIKNRRNSKSGRMPASELRGRDFEPNQDQHFVWIVWIGIYSRHYNMLEYN